MWERKNHVKNIIGKFYAESMKAIGHSWTRLNGVLRSVMANLIVAGIKFAVNDVAKGSARLRWRPLE